MLKCILGLIEPDHGSILVDGKETVRAPSQDRHELMSKFGMLFQGAALFDSLRVWENVAFGLIQGRGMAKKQAQEIAIEKLVAVGLRPEVGNLYPAELSGGMQNAWVWRAQLPPIPKFCFSMSPPPALIRLWPMSSMI